MEEEEEKQGRVGKRRKGKKGAGKGKWSTEEED